MKRKFYIDLLNVMACMSVVLMHCNSNFWEGKNRELWFFSNVIESISYYAVPVFFMITGATLLEFNERYSVKVYAKKRLKKTLLPFLAWITIACFLRIYLENMRVDSLANVIDGVFNTRFFDVYWFFIPLFSIYLAIPVYASINNKKNVYIYLVVYSFITISVLPFLFQVLNIEYNASLYCVVGGGYSIYALLGYLIDKQLILKKRRILIYILSFVGMIVHLFGTYYLSTPGEINKLFKGYLNVPCVLYSVGIFLFFSSLRNEENIPIRFKTIIIKLSDNTFGIYLLHAFIIRFLSKIHCVDVNSLSWIFGGSILVFVISFVLTLLLKKLPLFKYLVP